MICCATLKKALSLDNDSFKASDSAMAEIQETGFYEDSNFLRAFDFFRSKVICFKLFTTIGAQPHNTGAGDD